MRCLHTVTYRIAVCCNLEHLWNAEKCQNLQILIFARKMFVRSKTFHSNICIACKDRISSQNKSHTHTSLPSSPSPEERSSAALSLVRMRISSAGLCGVPAPGAESPSLSPRDGRWIIKREITSAAENLPQPVRIHTVKTRHQYKRHFQPCLLQAKMWILVPCICIWTNSWLLWDGLVQYIMTTLKYLRNTVQKNTEWKKSEV